MMVSDITLALTLDHEGKDGGKNVYVGTALLIRSHICGLNSGFSAQAYVYLL